MPATADWRSGSPGFLTLTMTAMDSAWAMVKQNKRAKARARTAMSFAERRLLV
jgi:hypothetical protein